MEREFFKNFPDTTTPLSAQRLNGLLNGKEAMANIVVDSIKGKNLFNEDTIIRDYELIGSGTYAGGLNPQSGWYVSDYIEVIPNKEYYLTKGTSGSSVCFYNSNKNHVTTLTGLQSGLVTIPNDSNIKYMRFNGTLAQLSGVQFEKGNTATNYAPYVSFAYKEPIIISKAGTGTPTSFTLPEDISNYKYIDFVVARSSDYGQAVCRVYYDTWYTPNVGHANMFYTDSNSSFFIESIKFSVSGKNVTITAKTINIFGQTIDPSDNIAFRLLVVYGYK